MQSARVPDAKALTRSASQPNGNGVNFHPRITVASRNFTRQPRTDRAITVGNAIGELATAARFNRRQNIGNHLVRFIGGVERIVAVDLTILRLICSLFVNPQNVI